MARSALPAIASAAAVAAVGASDIDCANAYPSNTMMARAGSRRVLIDAAKKGANLAKKLA
jgi:hypothetical protein